MTLDLVLEDLEIIRANARRFQSLGKLEDALDCFETCFEETNRLLGPHDVLTIRSKFEYAQVLFENGFTALALHHLLQVLFARQMSIRNSDHPEIVNVKDSIAEALVKQKQFNEAITIYREVLESRTKVFGEEHASTMRSKGNLALVLGMVHKYSEAIQLLTEVVTTLEENDKIGPSHDDTVTVNTQLAKFYLEDCQYLNAVTIADLILYVARKDNPNYMVAMNIHKKFYALFR